MASQPVLDLASLLAPISSDNPTGVDLRLDASPLSNYQTIKTARYAARDAEKNNLYKEANGEADEHWRKILSLAPGLLLRESKDLEVATWLTEALIRRNGFQGLRDAFGLIEGLLDNFWDNLYPLPDEEDGIETRVAPLAGLSGTNTEGVLIAPIRRVPLTEGYSPGPFAYWQYQQAVELERITNEDARISKTEKLGFTLADIERAVEESAAEFIIDQFDDINVTIDSAKRVEKLLDELCGSEHSPSMRAIVNALEECRGALNHIAKHKLPIEVAQTSDAQGTPAAATTNAVQSPGVVVSNALVSREAAFKQLLDIAKFFRTTEPHSPVSYALEKAVKWGNMPLDELIVELIPDSSSRKHFSELTGVKTED
ncbi:MAG TPA: type VI secretion system protein TssA [Cellvibrio sp.]|nr:type VI secretion system protein TssA [Cellvibrio sp.]